MIVPTLRLCLFRSALSDFHGIQPSDHIRNKSLSERTSFTVINTDETLLAVRLLWMFIVKMTFTVTHAP